MRFQVLPAGRFPPESRRRAFLLTDLWDDWFKYNTLYALVVFDEQAKRHDIGGVKIGQFDMKEGQRRPEIPDEFDELDEQFFRWVKTTATTRRLITWGWMLPVRC